MTLFQAVHRFVASGPPAGTGLHRYVFLLFKQSTPTLGYERPLTSASFDVEKFVQEEELDLLDFTYYYTESST